ncbi:MAG: site-specific integrase [Desulfamplus sp.]|nr:site-specific integrase [Desulfamplus sp.]
MTQLRAQFKRHLTLKRFSPKTHTAYLNAVKGLAEHYGLSPDQLTDEQIQDYFVHLIEDRKYAWSSCNVIFCGVKLFYEEILDRDTRAVIPPRPRQKQLPNILSQDEVERLLDSCGNLKHRALLLCVYSAGLRVSDLRSGVGPS